MLFSKNKIINTIFICTNIRIILTIQNRLRLSITDTGLITREKKSSLIWYPRLQLYTEFKYSSISFKIHFYGSSLFTIAVWRQPHDFCYYRQEHQRRQNLQNHIDKFLFFIICFILISFKCKMTSNISSFSRHCYLLAGIVHTWIDVPLQDVDDHGPLQFPVLL